MQKESVRAKRPQREYPPLDEVLSELVDTGATAHYTGLAPKTLNNWASTGGPLMPKRRDCRNRYSVEDIRQFVSGRAA